MCNVPPLDVQPVATCLGKEASRARWKKGYSRILAKGSARTWHFQLVLGPRSSKGDGPHNANLVTFNRYVASEESVEAAVILSYTAMCASKESCIGMSTGVMVHPCYMLAGIQTRIAFANFSIHHGRWPHGSLLCLQHLFLTATANVPTHACRKW